MSDQKKFILPTYQNLEKEYADSVRCNRCGFCETVCPTYVVTGKETLSPRGRTQAFRQILEGKILNPGDASEVFSTCLTCHACTNVCFSQVPVGKLMAQAKAMAASQEKYRWFSALATHILRFLLSHRAFLTILLWPFFLLKRIGISGFLNSIGLLNWISPELSRAEEMLPQSPLSFSIKIPKMDGGKRINYFSGCGTHYIYPNIGQACAKVLEKTGFSINKSSHPCCGLIANSAADVEGARRLAKKNIQFFSGSEDPIFIDDDSCYGFMKGYGDLLGGDKEAVKFSKRVKNLAQLLSETDLNWGKIDHPKVTVTCHDSCQIGNAYGETYPPRKVLKSLNWVEFKEMEESTWCCGGAGSYCIKHPKLSEDILERKLKNVEATQAQVVVAGASSCLMQMQHGNKKNRNEKLKVLHLAELIAAGFVVQSGLKKPLL